MAARFERLTRVLAPLLVVGVVAACASTPGRGVGSQAAAVVLTFANGNHDHVALQPYADAVATATGGTVTIQFSDGEHRAEPAYESAIIDDIAAGTFDLGWVAPRPWHGKGVHSFDALMAPFLIDSYALERAVLESEIEQQMLAGLEGSGVVGLGILPGPLRRVATAEEPFRTADDLRGAVVGIQASEIAARTFEAMGASTVELPSGGALGRSDAVEQQLGSLVGNRYSLDLPHVTVDVALWPRPLILFANADRFASLSESQQQALRAATQDLLPAALVAVESEDASALADLCAAGADIVVAGADAADALRMSVQAVYDQLAKDASTASMVQQIEAMKARIEATTAPACPIALATPSPATVGGFPEGTYQARQSCAELEAWWAAHPELQVRDRAPCPTVMEFTLKDGRWIENYGEQWSYSFFGDHVQLGNFTMRWSWDGERLVFSEIVGGEPGDAQAWLTKAFVRIAEPTTPAVGFPDGTYRAQISAGEMRAFWEANAVPVDLREPCPCERAFSLRDGVWSGDDGSSWEPSFFGDKLTLTDREGAMTVRWRYDPQVEEVTFLDVDAGGGAEEADLGTFFLVRPFDRVDP